MLFNQIPLGDFQFAVLARHAHDDLKLDRVAILYRNDDDGNGMMDNIRKALLEMPPLEGVFGKTQFARDGTVRKAISIKTFRGGKPAVVKAYSLDEVLRMQ